MEHFIENVSVFLNQLDKHVVSLISPKYSKMISHPHEFNDLNIILLFGNHKKYIDAFVNAFIMSLHSKDKLIKTTSAYNDDIAYTYSDHHFEFPYSIKHVAFIKTIVNNRSISKQQTLFYLKDVDLASKNDQNALSRIVEKHNNVKFIMSSKNTSNIHQNIISRSSLINLAFPPIQIYNLMTRLGHVTSDFPNFELEFNGKYQRNIILFLTCKQTPNKMETLLFETIILIKKERNMLQVVIKIRELCYKLYHMNIPLRYICQLVLNKYNDSKHIAELVNICAKAEHNSVTCSKSILMYENFFLRLYKFIKNRV